MSVSSEFEVHGTATIDQDYSGDEKDSANSIEVDIR